MAVLFALVVSALALSTEVVWAFNDYENDAGGPVMFDCPSPGQGLTEFSSSRTTVPPPTGRRKRNTVVHDRLWDFSCSEIDSKAKEYCSEFEDINEPGDKLMLFQCPANAYIAGIRSVFDSATNDRVWGFKCCRTLGVCTRDCELIGPLGLTGESIEFQIDHPGYFITGVYSVFDDIDDRIFFVEVCRAVQCGSKKLLKYIFPWAKK